MARHLPPSSLAEARAYLADLVLGARLRKRPRRLSISKADLKFRSSMMLFSKAAIPSDMLFQDALDRYFDCERDEATLALLGNIHD